MTNITSLDQLDLNQRYTYADYLTWKFQERVELLHGMVVKMSPAPNRQHQSINTDLVGYIWGHLNAAGSKCHLFSAPFDVRLPSIKVGQSDTVVQPDITLVCDEDKLDEQGCNGAPDLVVEILSPGNSQKEMKHKFDLYQYAKIREYWVVDPMRQTVLLYTLNEQGEYFTKRPFTAADTLAGSSVLPDLKIDLNTIFN